MRDKAGDLAKFIDDFLREQRLPVADLARVTGIKQGLISMWRSHPNISPKLDTLIAISKYMGITVSQLIGQEPIQHSHKLQEVIDMLEQLSPMSLKAVAAVTKTYYDMETEEKVKSESAAG